MALVDASAGQEAIAPVVFLPGVREADEQRAENVSLHALARRSLSRAEVVELLLRRGIDPIVADGEVERLQRVGLVDDAALALDLVERLVERKRLGGGALRAELQRRRLDSAAIESALASREAVDETAVLRDLVDDRLRRLGELDRETAERRLLGHLARKGHAGSAAREAVGAALDEAGLERAPRSGLGQRSGFGQRGGLDRGGFARAGGSAQRGGRSGEPTSGAGRVEFE